METEGTEPVVSSQVQGRTASEMSYQAARNKWLETETAELESSGQPGWWNLRQKQFCTEDTHLMRLQVCKVNALRMASPVFCGLLHASKSARASMARELPM